VQYFLQIGQKRRSSEMLKGMFKNVVMFINERIETFVS